jgi:hypothetical protein
MTSVVVRRPTAVFQFLANRTRPQSMPSTRVLRRSCEPVSFRRSDSIHADSYYSRTETTNNTEDSYHDESWTVPCVMIGVSTDGTVLSLVSLTVDYLHLLFFLIDLLVI